MQAERLILETDTSGKVRRMPRLPPNQRFEAIFLAVEVAPATSRVRRRPHKDIVGRIKVLGDTLTSAPPRDWNLPA